MRQVAMVVGILVALAAPGMNSKADAFDDCVDEKIREFKKIEQFMREGSVRCEGAGLSGRSHRKNGEVSFRASPGYQLVGSVRIQVLSSNRGSQDAAVYERDAQQKVVGVSVPISCESPSQLFGPGAWMHIRISGETERPPSEKELKQLFRECRSQL